MEEQPAPPGPSEADTEQAETASRSRSRAETWASRGRCGSVATSTSHTRYHKRRQYETDHRRVTRDEFYSEPETISGSSDTYHCVHGPTGKIYTEKGLLKRNLLKELDPIPFDPKWTQGCDPAYGWDIASKLEFLVTDPTVDLQRERLENHVRDFAKISANGYRVDTLASLCVTLEYLVTAMERSASLRVSLNSLLQNLEKPILLRKGSDVVTYFDAIRHFIGYLGYMLARLQDEEQFDLVARAMMWQLSAGAAQRGAGAAGRALLLAAAAQPLLHTVVRMIAFSSSRRFPTFLRIALLLACDSEDNCIEMVQENILENIFYRFNPYFPDKSLPYHDISPLDCQDPLVRLGDSSVHMSMTLSLLLVLLSATLRIVQREPARASLLPCPDSYALRCFVWAYRYECRARGRSHQRATLTVVVAVLLRCFSERLLAFSYSLMSDLLTLSVATEVPPRRDWTGSVQFSTSQQDVLFKKLLIYVCVDCIKVFPYNKFMMESRLWLLGLSYLLDPGLCHLRARWSPPLFAEIRKVTLQALVLTLPLCDPQVITNYGIIRRILWYIEWYSEKPYEISVLYWCVRVLHVAMHARSGPARQHSLRTLFNTHGIIILVQLCRTVLRASLPLVESAQCVLSVCLRVLASCSARDRQVSCVVYPQLRWPAAAHALAVFSLDVTLLSLKKNYILNNRYRAAASSFSLKTTLGQLITTIPNSLNQNIERFDVASDRWPVALLDFIWEAVVWKPEHRKQFVADNGIYKLLDLITCLALACVCDCARAAGAGLAHLLTWRAPLQASHVSPTLVKRGATIASLLAAVFREECHREGVRLNHLGVLQDLECPIMSVDVRARVFNPQFDAQVNHDAPLSYVAADIAGSLKSKAFALLHLLSDDLEHKVALADEAYNLYRNVKLSVEEETVLVLCSFYLTLKVGEVWTETNAWGQGFVPHDQAIFDDFLQVTKGWSKEIKRQQEEVIARRDRKEGEEESTLYSFLGRVRLNIALDALREVRCAVRSSARAALSQALLHDAVRALRRRRAVQRPLLRTYVPPLDVQNVTGQNVKVLSILPKDKPQPRDEYLSSSTALQ